MKINMGTKKAKPVILTVLIAYTSLLMYWMLFGFGRMVYDDYLYNLMPFKSIYETFEIYIWYVKNMPDSASNEFWRFAVNIFGNVAVFVPFGILLTILFDGRFIKSLIVFEFGIMTLEIIQLISRRGVFDIDDFILNTIGFLMGYAIIKIANKFINKINSGRSE